MWTVKIMFFTQNQMNDDVMPSVYQSELISYICMCLYRDNR
jgi:hypothetical protein